MKKKILLIFGLLLIVYISLFIVSPVLAQESLTPPVEGDMTVIIGRAIKFILGLVGVLALVFIIYGGLLWMTSAGNVEKVKKGKSAIVWASLGLIVCFLAYSIVTFVITRTIGLGGETGGMPPTNPDQLCIDRGGICVDDCSNNCVGPGMVCEADFCGGARQCCLSGSL